MRITHPVLGKILQHSEGLGVPSPDTVRERAGELALIEGRTAYTEQDLRRAFQELHGGHHDLLDGNGNLADEEMRELISERDMIATSLGHHVERMEVDGGHSLGEELVAEGLDEATHEQMLESRRAEFRDEEG